MQEGVLEAKMQEGVLEGAMTYFFQFISICL